MASIQDYDKPAAPAPKRDLPVPKFSDIDLDTLQVKFADPKSSKSVACFFSIKHPKTGDRVPFIYRTPKMSLPFGVSDYVNDKTGNVSWSITATFDGEDPSNENDTIHKYRTFLENVTNRFYTLFYPKANDWLVKGAGKKKKGNISEEEFRDMVLGMIRENDDSKYSDFVRETIANERVKEADGKISYTNNMDADLRIAKYDYNTKSTIPTTPSTFKDESKRCKAYRCVHLVGTKINPSRNVLSFYTKVKQILYYEAPPVDEYMESFNNFKLAVSDDEDEDGGYGHPDEVPSKEESEGEQEEEVLED